MPTRICPHCAEPTTVRTGEAEHRCVECGKTFTAQVRDGPTEHLLASFAHAMYVGGHSELGRERRGTLYVTNERVGIGKIRPQFALIPIRKLANVKVVGGQVAKNNVGAVIAFGVLGGLAAKSAKNQSSIIVRTKEGETGYYTIDKISPIEVLARLTPGMKELGVPCGGEEPSIVAPGSSSGTRDLAVQLRELAALRDDGLLTGEEFEMQRTRLLGGS